MIATISKQGGRRYPQMRAGFVLDSMLAALGTTAPVVVNYEVIVDAGLAFSLDMTNGQLFSLNAAAGGNFNIDMATGQTKG